MSDDAFVIPSKFQLCIEEKRKDSAGIDNGVNKNPNSLITNKPILEI